MSTQTQARESGQKAVTNSAIQSQVQNKGDKHANLLCLQTLDSSEREIKTRLLDSNARSEEMYQSRILTLQAQLAAKERECETLQAEKHAQKTEFDRDMADILAELNLVRENKDEMYGIELDSLRRERDEMMVKLGEFDELEREKDPWTFCNVVMANRCRLGQS
jgi:uncharacterized protein YigA (DUF484 family)